MKYYAVTDDPTELIQYNAAQSNESNELMHYGIKGMKWGVIRTDAQLGHPKKSTRTRTRSTKPRSPAYMKAAAKLSSSMQRGIAKAQANWNAYNSPANKQIRADKRAYNKAVRDYKRGERLFEKHVQLARQGRLKYKGISDNEVQRITDRLALERNARSLSGAEKQSFGRRLRSSMAEGFVQGVGQGMATRTSEWVGRGSRLKTQRLMTEQQNRIHEQQARRDFDRSMNEAKIRDEYQDKITERREEAKAQRELRRDYEQAATEEGMHVRKHFISDKTRRKQLYDIQQKRIKDAASDSLEDYKERQKIAAKYKKGGKKGDKDSDEKPKKNSASGGDPSESDTEAPAARPHAKPAGIKKSSAASNKRIRAAARNARQQQNHLGNAMNRNQRFIDDLAEQESTRREKEKQASFDYWSRIHDFNEATRHAQERANAEADIARQKKLAEQGWADRQRRMNERAAESAYWTRIEDFGKEKRLAQPAVNNRVGNGTPYSRTSSVTQTQPSTKKKNRRDSDRYYWAMRKG